jgi:hypothetical protein
MKKNYLLLLFVVMFLADKIFAQTVNPCGTPDINNALKLKYPKIADYEVQLEKDIYNFSHKKDLSKYAKKTSQAHSDTDWYDIPVVVHVIHNYGPEYLTDNKVYELVNEFNKFFAGENDQSLVVKRFVPYIGKAKIRFHLATKDPFGNDTKGITHRFTYLTYGGDEQAKFDQWPPHSYLNLWFENTIGSKASTPGARVVAYTIFPTSAEAFPFNDGIVGNYQDIDDYKTHLPIATGGSYDHEVGHYFGLYHTFGNTNSPGPSRDDPATNFSGHCANDDGVDDTPPTDGCLGCCDLGDTVCSFNYFKIYPDMNGKDSLVNYPDTANEQNIMNYAECKLMFTKGQVQRMRGTLNSDVAGRNNLWDSTNLVLTGANRIIDLAPINEFSVKDGSVDATYNNTYFTCPGTSLNFACKSWNDTITDVTWTFSNGATIPTDTKTQSSAQANTGTNVPSSVVNAFTDPGWVSITLAATGNHTGTTTTNFNRTVFVADKVGTPADGYFMEFNNADTAKWPMFNYYNNGFKWQYTNVGYYDNSAIEYKGFDDRGINFTGSPLGDYDDLYSMPMDFTSFGTGPCNLNYYYSAASRTAQGYNINDCMEIYYSTDHAKTWKRLDSLVKTRLINKGTLYTAYTPSAMSDWAPMSIPVPTAARTAYTVFRFRYHPSVAQTSAGTSAGTLAVSNFSTGNNFYMDRINFSQWPAVVNEVKLTSMDVKIVPNPTAGNAYVVIKDADKATVHVVVSDITGKQVFATSQQIMGSQASIEIPQDVISVKGIYMVQTITGNQAHTQKLVVY